MAYPNYHPTTGSALDRIKRARAEMANPSWTCTSSEPAPTTPDPLDLHDHARVVRNLVWRSFAQTYGLREDLQSKDRRMMIEAIYGDVDYPDAFFVITVHGSPCRGMCLVNLYHENAPAVDFWSHRPFSGPESAIIRRFVLKVRQQCYDNKGTNQRFGLSLNDSE